MDEIKVSVIIPIYNTEKYLAECLESIINQTLKQIEIICIDDGSSDGSAAILKEYAQNDLRISMYTQKNRGVSAARNVGVRHARGKYLFFMDSDDILEKNALEILSETLNKHDLQVLYCDGTSFAESDACREAAEKFHNYYTRKNEYPLSTTGIQLMTDMLKNQEYRATCCLHMVRRDYFLKRNLWFIENIVHEDNYYVFCCMINAERAGYIHIAPYKRRVHANSIMTRKLAFINSYGYFVDYTKMKSFLETKNFSEEEETELYDLVYKHFRNARDIYGKIDESEKEKVNELSAQEKLFYRAYIIDYLDMKDKMNSKCEVFQKQKENMSLQLGNEQKERTKLNIELEQVQDKIKLANEEKEQLNSAYQSVCQEKSELDTELQNVRKDNAKKEKKIKQMTNEIETLNKNFFIRLSKFIRRKKKKLKTRICK